MKIRGDIFEDCDSKEKIMERILSFARGSDISEVSRLASEKFLEIGEIDLSAKFYISSKEQKHQETLKEFQDFLVIVIIVFFILTLFIGK